MLTMRQIHVLRLFKRETGFDYDRLTQKQQRSATHLLSLGYCAAIRKQDDYMASTNMWRITESGLGALAAEWYDRLTKFIALVALIVSIASYVRSSS